MSVYPSMETQMAGYVDALPEAMRAFLSSDLATPDGYLDSTIFTILGPVILVAAAVTFGARAIAGEEEARTLPVLLSAPVSRVRVALGKLAALTLLVTAIAAVLFLVLLGLVAAFDLGVGADRLLAATVHLHALALFAGGLAFAVGATTARRASAIGVAVGVVVLGFVVNGVAGFVDGLDVAQRLSPFYWYAGGHPVVDGFSFGWLALLYGVAVLLTALGVWRFDRRDLT